MITNSLSFEIRRCQPGPGKECFDEKKINDFIYDIHVDMWSFNAEANMQKYNEHDMELYTTSKILYLPLYFDKSVHAELNLRTHTIETYDNPFHDFWTSQDNSFTTVGRAISFTIVKEYDPSLVL